MGTKSPDCPQERSQKEGGVGGSREPGSTGSARAEVGWAVHIVGLPLEFSEIGRASCRERV